MNVFKYKKLIFLFYIYLKIIIMFMKLRDCISINNLNWSTLSKNPNAIELIINNQNKINWIGLS